MRGSELRKHSESLILFSLDDWARFSQMGTLKPNMGANLREIRTILLREWDPIGVRDIPAAHDEYDSYAMPLYVFLRGKPSDAAVADHLYRLETQQMGLTRFGRRHLKPIVDRLLRLDLSKDEPLQ